MASLITKENPFAGYVSVASHNSHIPNSPKEAVSIEVVYYWRGARLVGLGVVLRAPARPSCRIQEPRAAQAAATLPCLPGCPRLSVPSLRYGLTLLNYLNKACSNDSIM